ncbi:MAG: DNA repair protein RecO [Brumimicrobium sp.]
MKSVQKGILLKRINYSETSLILHFFTLELGFQAYLFQGAKKKKGNILQPLSLIEISSYTRQESDLAKISEVNALYVAKSIPFHPIKSGIAFYLTEVLAQVLRDNDKDIDMFDFISQEIEWLDNSDMLRNYPIWFLLKLSEKLGVGIQVENPNGKIFNIQEGEITNQTPKSQYYQTGEVVEVLKGLLGLERSVFLTQQIPKIHRKELLSVLTDYYKFHIHGFKTPKSLEVIQLIFE